MKQWFVGETVRNREVAASMSVVALGLEAYVPLDPRMRLVGRKLIETNAPRYGIYIFVRFDRVEDPWERLVNDWWDKRQYFRRILSDRDESDPYRRPLPTPVPDKVMDVIKSYKPAPVEPPKSIVYRPGQQVNCIIAPGVVKQAVFVEYCGSTPMVETWIFGGKHTVPVTLAQLEPLEFDNA